MDDMYYRQRINEYYKIPIYEQEELEGIPSEEELLPAIIRIFKENGELTLKELRQLLKEWFWMDEGSFKYKVEDSRHTAFALRVYKIVYHLFRHFLLERTARGTYKLSRWGEQIAESYPLITYDEIKRFPTRIPEHRVTDDIEEVPYHKYVEILYPDIELFDNDNINISYFGFPIEVPNYREPEESWLNLSEEEYQFIYNNDTRFRNLIRTGRFIFKDGRIVPIRYKFGDGKYSSLVLNAVHGDSIRIEVRKNYNTHAVYFKDVYYHDRPITRIEFFTICRKPFDWEDIKTENIIERLLRELPETPVEIYEYLRKELGIKWGALAKVMAISTRQLQNWRKPTKENEEETRNTIGLKNLVALCLALQLPFELSEEIIKRVGAEDKNGDPYDPDAAGGEQRVWQMLLKRHYMKSTLEINELCKKNDIDCLFSENPEDHEDETKIDHGIERKDKK